MSVWRVLSGVLGLVVVVGAAVRLTVSRSVLPYWDFDPFLLASVETGLSPGVSVLIDGVVISACGGLIAIEVWRGRRVWWWGALLLGVALVFVVLHGWVLRPIENAGSAVVVRGHAGSRVLGLGWLSACCGMWALAHAARDAWVRRVCAGALLGVGGLVVAKSVGQGLVELPAVAERLAQDAEAVLAARGAEVGSVRGEVLLRKLSKPDVTGWVGLANPWGAVVAAVLALALSCAMCGVGRAVRGRERWGGVGVAIALVVGVAVSVVLTRSKGAIGLGVLVGVAMAAVWWRAWVGEVVRRRLGVLLVVGLVGSAGLLGARALVGASGALGDERSLLFRGQYLAGTARALGDAGVGGVLVGLGPGSYQGAYGRVKDASWPETVNDAHSVVVHLPAVLGVGGVAMIGVFVGLVALRRVGVRRREGGAEVGAGSSRAGMAMVAGSLGALGVVHLWIRWVELALGGLGLGVLLVGLLAGGVAGGVGVSVWAAGRGRRTLAAALAVGAWGLVTHAHIDVTATLVATAGVVGVFAGLAMPVGLTERRRGPVRVVGLAGGVAMVACGVAVVVAGALPMLAWERVLREAGAEASAAREALVEGGGRGSVEAAAGRALEAALAVERGAALLPSSRETGVLAVRVWRRAYELRLAGGGLPALEASVREGFAGVLADQGERWGGSSSTMAAVSRGWVVVARGGGDEAALERAVASGERAWALSPADLGPGLALFEALMVSGDGLAAAEVAQRLLEIDAARYLDPLTGLGDRERSALEAVVGEPEGRR